MGSGDSGVQGQRAKQQGILHSTWAFGFPPPVSSTPVEAARSRPGRQVGDPYQAQKLLARSNQRDTTYSPFTLTYYLRPRRWAMPGGLGHLCIGTGSVASLSVAQPFFSPISYAPVGAARSRPGRQVGDPYQAQKLWLAATNGIPPIHHSLLPITFAHAGGRCRAD